MKSASVMLLIAILVSCNRSAKPTAKDITFKKPVISQPVTNDTLKQAEPDCVFEIFPRFAGKHKFCDTLFIPGTSWTRDTTYRNDFVRERLGGQSDSLATDGFEIIPDYPSVVYDEAYTNRYGNIFYPVHIINQTPVAKEFIGKDGYL